MSQPVTTRGALASETLRQRGPAPLRRGRVDPSPRHLRIVDARRRGRRAPVSGARLVLASVALMAVGVVFGLVYLHVVMAQRQFALDRLDQQRAAAEAQYADLRLQVAQLSSPRQIMSTAEGKLGMRPPASVTYLTPPAAVAGLTGAAPAPGAAGVGADWPRIKALLAGTP
ncbi:MAG: cell division protein FtsL [Acidimicrobiales bacterium]